MNSAVSEWLNLGLRWLHIFSAILWVGQTYYFTWLDRQFSKIERGATDGKRSAVWMVHSGGFYTVEKQKSLGVAPLLVHWFRWEAMLTWLSGLALLTLVYYASSGFIDPDVAKISQGHGILIGIAVVIGGWVIYDLAVRSVLGKSESVFAVFAFLATGALSWGLLHAFSARAAYLHVGALFGTIMTLNVWQRILPTQRRMIAAAAAGAAFDAKLGAQAKLRTKHNTFMAVPVVFLMISNHFPVATYGNKYSWEILLALVVAGGAAAKVIRSA